ncbi:unnamed protein product [Cladocopium goreaui]|uniref:Uncharacterized protein n=1 Tax=Cladocopium goreaui TaxID=2562237 RepID=A0A9P1BFS9_9DINO|nr:unnamed protein product [Cladocopium goreaui]
MQPWRSQKQCTRMRQESLSRLFSKSFVVRFWHYGVASESSRPTLRSLCANFSQRLYTICI